MNDILFILMLLFNNCKSNFFSIKKNQFYINKLLKDCSIKTVSRTPIISLLDTAV